MLQNLSEEIRECLGRAEECKRLAKTALTLSAIKDYLEMEQRWLALARSYEFAERLSRFVEPLRRKKRGMNENLVHKVWPGRQVRSAARCQPAVDRKTIKPGR
jgi:hypothetical protein